MILSRVIEHVKAQNWTAVALDFVIVVMGVFIGIQVSNWNEARHERMLERGYLERLHADFVRSVENADDNIVNMEREFRLEGEMLDRLRACRLDDAARKDFDLGIYLVGRLEPPPLVRDTIDELQSTGRMEIIRNVKLRSELADILRRQKSNAEVLSYIVARVTPQITYVDSRVVLTQPPGGFSDVSEKGLPRGAADYDFQALCADRKYLAAISTLQETTRVVISHNRARRRDYKTIISMLENEPGLEGVKP